MAITGRTKLAAVIGWPVGHSISPCLHGYWLNHHGIDGAYVPLAVRPEDLADAARLLPRIGFVGFNVTVPHKEAALALVDEADAEALRIGAVNTVIVEADGRLRGKNTDAFGFLQGLRAGLPDWNPGHGPAVVIGAGGASRAVCAALIGAGVTELRVVNRTLTRAEAIAVIFNSTMIDVYREHDERHTVRRVATLIRAGFECRNHENPPTLLQRSSVWDALSSTL